MKKYLIDKPDRLQLVSTDIWPQLIDRLQRDILAWQRSSNVMKRIGDLLIRVYLHVKVLRNLIEYLFKLVDENLSENVAIFFLHMTELLCELAWDDDLFMEFASHFFQIFEKCLKVENLAVRVSSLRAISIFLAHVGDEGMLQQIESILQLLLKHVIEVIQVDEDAGVEVCNSLSELCASHPKSIKSIFDDYFLVHLEILNQTQFGSGDNEYHFVWLTSSL
jgi:hypothetical protein